MRNALITGSMLLCLVSLPALAQRSPVVVAATSNQPGEVSMVDAVQASARVTAVDSSSRTVTLKGPEGRIFNVIAGDEVKNFAQIAVGDEVVVDYVRAISLHVQKSSGLRQRSERAGSARAMPGAKPAGVAGREVRVVADVIAVDPKKRTITLRGPEDRVVELDVTNPDHFKVVKAGDQVEANYVESMAISVQPMAATGAAK